MHKCVGKWPLRFKIDNSGANSSVPFFLPLSLRKILLMRKALLPIVLVIAGIAIYLTVFRKGDKKEPEAPKQQPIAVSKYSPAFNHSVNSTLNAYYSLSEAFINWDSGAIRTNGAALQTALSGIAFTELKKDTVIHETAMSYVEALKGDLQAIVSEPDITAKRHSFHSFSQNFYDLLRTIRFDGGKVYLQECPMAFNDTEAANWLSSTSAIRNPYLGLHHPRYKNGMLECGETKDSLQMGK